MMHYYMIYSTYKLIDFELLVSTEFHQKGTLKYFSNPRAVIYICTVYTNIAFSNRFPEFKY